MASQEEVGATRGCLRPGMVTMAACTAEGQGHGSRAFTGGALCASSEVGGTAPGGGGAKADSERQTRIAAAGTS